MNQSFSVEKLPLLRSLEGTPLASFRTRSAAFLLDLLLILAAVIVMGLPYAYWRYSTGAAKYLVVPFEPFHSLWGVVALLLYFGLGTYFWRGRTLGKRLLGIRVVSLVGERLTLWQSIERSLGYGASALEGGFGFLQVFWYHNRQAVHDRIAETIVVRDD